MPTRAEIDALPGPAIVEFGNAWCGHCRAAQPLIAQALASHAPLTRLRIADGKGLPLGRAFLVTLWPTLVFLRDGEEKARVVRPGSVSEINDALEKITG